MCVVVFYTFCSPANILEAVQTHCKGIYEVDQVTAKLLSFAVHPEKGFLNEYAAQKCHFSLWCFEYICLCMESHTSKRPMWSCLRGSIHSLCSQLTSIKLLIENPVQQCNNIQNSRCTWSEASEIQHQKSLTGKTNCQQTEDEGKHKKEMRESRESRHVCTDERTWQRGTGAMNQDRDAQSGRKATKAELWH